MGYDINRFEDNVDEELICPICSFILEDPVQAPDCEHAFCNTCINQWLKHQSICPIDRAHIQSTDLKPVPRILKNLLSKYKTLNQKWLLASFNFIELRLRLRCDHATYGCQAIIRLENLNSHLQECEFNPKKPIVCSIGCDMIIAKDEIKNHNCIRELRKMVDEQQNKINQLTNELVKQKSDLDNCVNEMRSLRNFASRYFRVSNSIPTSLSGCSGTSLNLTDDDDIVRWSATLPLAKVTRWGGIISTPDAVLQTVIKRALIESNCPQAILNDLMNNAHERHWPPGLSTLETRQINRNHYVNFVCKRVPNKQAVMILAVDNRDMPNHLIVEPGIILIFAHGVE